MEEKGTSGGGALRRLIRDAACFALGIALATVVPWSEGHGFRYGEREEGNRAPRQEDPEHANLNGLSGVVLGVRVPSWLRQSSYDLGDLRAVRADPGDASVASAVSEIASALGRYNGGDVARFCRVVYVVDTIEIVGSSDIGGTWNRDGSIAIALQANGRRQSLPAIVQVMHAEVSSLILASVRDREFDEAWIAANEPGFEYGAGGVLAVMSGKASTTIESQWLRRGLLNEYASSSLQNDFNQCALILMSRPDLSWGRLRVHPRLRRKLSIVRSLYEDLGLVKRDWWGWETFRQR